MISFDKEKWVSRAKVAVPVLLISGFALGTFFNLDEHSRERTRLELETLKLQGEIDLLSTEENVVKTKVEEVDKTLKNVASAGQEVAKIQNGYIDYLQNSDSYSKEQSATIITDLRNKMKYYLKDTDDTWTWYQYGDNAKWRFLTNYETSLNEIPSVWVCENEKGEIVAFAKATFNTTTKTFGAVQKVDKGTPEKPAPVTTMPAPRSDQQGGAVR